MSDSSQKNSPDDAVSFDIAVTDPAAFYATPEEVAADQELTVAQKRRFLTEWATDIEQRQTSADEGMSAATPADPSDDAARLQRIQASLAELPETDAEAQTESTIHRLWRRLTS